MISITNRRLSPIASWKVSMVVLFVLGFGRPCFAQGKEGPAPTLGQYWFVMYTSGTNWQDSSARRKIFPDHISYIGGLRKTGKIISGGAFADNGPWLGFEIYSCKTKEEVIKITEGDPMVSSRQCTYEIRPWKTIKGTVTFD